MRKKIIIAIVLLSLMLATLGCEELSRLTQETAQKSAPSNLQILKAVELGAKWEMKQLRFDIGAGDEVAILLKLAQGDKVDGYFYLEKGESIDFRITGKSLLFSSEAQDRFSFVAEQTQGDTYTLTFRNTEAGDQPAKVTVFLEVIYPVGGSLYVPVEEE
ncbi:MAG TPA: emp24/gp25L/p24 family protein [Dehalococcoidia bacterium]|jgi:hypothetical protein|nr:emp24/gp25L/p24 family protein [Dehalococcoidia bacterium]